MSMKSMKGKWIKYIPLLGLCLPVSGQAQEEIAQDAVTGQNCSVRWQPATTHPFG